MLNSKVNSIRKRHFGKVNSTSSRDKKIKPRKIMTRLSSSSNKLLSNFRSLKMSISPSMSTIPTQFFNL